MKKKKSNYKNSGLGLKEAVELCERYNRKHKTAYTYGQFISLLESGKIKVTRVEPVTLGRKSK